MGFDKSFKLKSLSAAHRKTKGNSRPLLLCILIILTELIESEREEEGDVLSPERDILSIY
jgi:hypothetical protein